VQFHWDRHGRRDQDSSCWIPVSQPWSGSGFGGINLPRVGQEVLVDFLGGDPDRPVIVGRVYTAVQQVPYALPADRTKSGWKSHSTPGGGGFNEISFDDRKGAELFTIRAEKDLTKLVQNDESETIRQNQRVEVGASRHTSISDLDASIVGTKHSVKILQPMRDVAGAQEVTSEPTMLEMSHEHIRLTTGGATIEMLGGRISMFAEAIDLFAGTTLLMFGSAAASLSSDGETTVHSRGRVTVQTTETAAEPSGDGHVVIESRDGSDVLIHGGPMVKINDP
jgi:type VI secretion system secreted protein VgrG